MAKEPNRYGRRRSKAKATPNAQWGRRVRSSGGRCGLAIALLMIWGATGCANGYTYRSSNLPADLQASSSVNAQTLDLSRFAGPPVNSELIDGGDIVQINVAAGLSKDAVTDFKARVNDDGFALLPEIGRVHLAGLSLTDAERRIEAACVDRGLYRQPQVTVIIAQRRMNRVAVVGGVQTPGVYELPRNSSYLFAAIIAAGGLAEDAGVRVEIRRPREPGRLAGPNRPKNDWGPQPGGAPVQLAGAQNGLGSFGPGTVETARIDLAHAAQQGGTSEYLTDGATVEVERRQPEPIQVIGLVRKPNQYEFPVGHELRLFGAIALAEGLSSKLADKVYVIRKTPTGESATIELSLRRAKRDVEENLRLAPGDIVVVEQTPATLVEDAFNFIRFGVGTSVSLF